MPSGDRSPLDRRLVEHVELGEWLDLAGDEPVDEQAMRVWGEDRTVSATVLRDIVRGVATDSPDPRGLQVRGARIAGRLDLAYITSSLPVSFNDCLFEKGLNAVDAKLPLLDLGGCVIEHPTDIPLAATGLHTTELGLRRATVSAAGQAAVVLMGADLGDLDCWGATVTNTAGIGVAADNIRVHRKALLGGGFTVISGTGEGAVSLNSGEIGEILCLDTTLRNDDGGALSAQNLRVHRHLTMRSGFRASGTELLGTINLDGAELGELDCAQAVLENSNGPGISMDDMRVHREVSFHDCTVDATGEGSAMSFVGAEIGELSCHTVTVRNTAGSALDLSDLRAHRSLYFRDCEFAAGGRGFAIDLENATVGGDLTLSGTVLTNPNFFRRLYLDGFTYATLPGGIHPRVWLMWLGSATPGYAAQPYQHLAAVHRAAGDDSQARRVLMAQRRDQLKRRALTGRAARGWVRFTGLALGYGYQPWRALIGLALVIATAMTLAVVLGGSGGLAQAADPTLPCPVVDRIGVGLDLGTPLLNTRARCDTTSSGAGQFLIVSGWVLRLLAWAFATLFIAGFTTAVRRT